MNATFINIYCNEKSDNSKECMTCSGAGVAPRDLTEESNSWLESITQTKTLQTTPLNVRCTGCAQIIHAGQ